VDEAEQVQQSLQTYGNKIFLNLAIAVYGVNPPVNQQTFNMPLEVTTVPAISLGVSLLSQTSGAATYLATVSTTSYAGGGDPESGAGIDDSGRDDDFQLEHGDWRNVLLVHGDGATGIVLGDGAAGSPGDASAKRGGLCDTGDAGGWRVAVSAERVHGESESLGGTTDGDWDAAGAGGY
jgi:hypothetical protein